MQLKSDCWIDDSQEILKKTKNLCTLFLSNRYFCLLFLYLYCASNSFCFYGQYVFLLNIDDYLWKSDYLPKKKEDKKYLGKKYSFFIFMLLYFLQFFKVWNSYTLFNLKILNVVTCKRSSRIKNIIILIISATLIWLNS